MHPAPRPSTPAAAMALAAGRLARSREIEAIDLPAARRLADEASELLAGAGDAARGELAGARSRAAELAMSCRDFTTAAARGLDAIVILENSCTLGEPGAPQRLSAARSLRSRALIFQGRFQDAMEELDRALVVERNSATPTATLREILLQRIDAGLKLGLTEGVEADCAEALALATQAGDRAGEGKCLAGKAQLQLRAGDTDGALASLRRMAEIGDETGDAFLRAYSRGQQARLLLTCGESGDVLGLLGEALEIARGSGAGASAFTGIMLGVAARAHSRRGEHAHALSAAEEAVAIARGNASAHDETQALAVLADCLREAGAADEAVRVARLGVASSDGAGNPKVDLNVRLMLANALVAQGERSEARTLLDDVLQRSAAPGLQHHEASALALRAEIELEAGSTADALRDIEGALKIAHASDGLHFAAGWELLAARIHEEHGDLRSALRCAREHARCLGELQRRRSQHSLEHWRAEHEMTFARLQAERLERDAARRGELQVRRLLETAPDAMLLIRADGTLAFANEEAHRLFGLPPGGAAARRAGDLMAEADRARIESELAAVFVSPERRTLGVSDDLRVQRADGATAPVEVSVSPFERDGELLMACAFRDVTARRTAQDDLRRAVGELQRLKERIEAENLYLREELDEALNAGDVVGRSPAVLGALHRLQQVAPTDAGVLLLGETGAGKEVFARAVHAMGRRSTRALVKVDCSALPGTLIESELFGHEKGAFTGAHSAKVGRFELADGGTIFLDEVGELPLDLQSKLLRVVQDQQFERVGSSTTRRVDVRIIAATNRDLERMAETGKFRADLYFRLSVFPIRIPPLRERMEDVELLAWHFIAAKQDRLRKRFDRISPELMSALLAHQWPGNVRELENTIERAMILSPEPELRLAEPIGGRQPPPQREIEAAPAVAASHLLKDVERAHLLEVLGACNWKVKGAGNAAERLGLSPSTLRHRMKQLGIDRPGAP